MFSYSAVTDSQQIKHHEQALRNAQSRLATAAQSREVRPGFRLEESDEEYRQACRRLAQARTQLTEAKSKITLDPAHRQPVLKLIDKLKHVTG